MFWNKNANVKNILFVILTIFIVWFICQIKDTALLAFACFVFSCSLTPAVDKLSKYINRGLASALVIIGIILVIILFFIPIVTISIQEIHQLIGKIPAITDSLINFLNSYTIMEKTLIEYIDIDDITVSSSQVASGIVNKSINITVTAVEILTIAITMGVIVFYMIYEKNLIKNTVIILFPPKLKERAKEVYINIEKKVGGYVIAQVLSMLTVAIVTAIGLIALKVEYALLMGLIAGILDIVPIIGPTLALLLGILCASQQGVSIIILTAIVYLLAQWISNNFVRPLVFGKFLDLHPLIIIFAFLISAQFLGVWGVILSPAIAALLLTLFDELYLKTVNCKIKEKSEEI